MTVMAGTAIETAVAKDGGLFETTQQSWKERDEVTASRRGDLRVRRTWDLGLGLGR